jgi:hypothetical protein
VSGGRRTDTVRLQADARYESKRPLRFEVRRRSEERAQGLLSDLFVSSTIND